MTAFIATYIIKVLLCNALMLLVYKLFLEKEKMHIFNRFYLLMSLAFSFVVPFLTFKVHETASAANKIILKEIYIAPVDKAIQLSMPAQATTTVETFNYLSILWILYISVSAILLLRFIYNLINILLKVYKADKAAYHNAKIVLIKGNSITYSFLHYIFLDKDDYHNGNAEPEVLLHELTHIQQKHSLDILFIEILQIVFWLNPLLIFYRKAIQLNHEFLADDSVIKTYHNPSGYQYLLIDKIASQSSSSLASRFNFLTTKKRLLMMTKTTSGKVAILKQTCAAVLFIASVFLFSSSSNAQVQPEKSKPNEEPTAPYGPGASQELMNEYYATINAMTFIDSSTNAKTTEVLDMNKGNFERLAFIYKQMNKAQRDESIQRTKVQFLPAPPPPPKAVPTTEQLELWKNSDKYSITIDGKEVDNNILNNYKNTDFAQAFESRFNKSGNKKQLHQVSLVTNQSYDHMIKNNANIYLKTSRAIGNEHAIIQADKYIIIKPGKFKGSYDFDAHQIREGRIKP